MTLQWFERIAPIVASGRPVLFEGQMRLAFVQEALHAHGITGARVICVECDDPTRTARLTRRGQPELANESMMGWSHYLHDEAVAAGYEILDTTDLSLVEVTSFVVSGLYGSDSMAAGGESGPD